MHTRTLLLTPWYFPQRILRWQDAITMVYLQKADVVVEYSETVRSPSVEMRLPAVIRAHRGQAKVRRGIKFSRLNVFLRDRFTCQYCQARLPASRLSFDHVFPRSAGGKTEWSNIVTSCRPCNTKKGNHTCDEAGMWPLYPPARPRTLPFTPPLIHVNDAPDEWLDFLETA